MYIWHIIKWRITKLHLFSKSLVPRIGLQRVLNLNEIWNKYSNIFSSFASLTLRWHTRPLR